MDNATRLQYLEAMGIDVWVSRKTNEVKEIKSVEKNDLAHTDQTSLVSEDWTSLQNEVAHCQLCTLSETRTQTVFGSGSRNADWMMIGEAPGHHEDKQGEPFVGQAGKLLTEMIRAIGLERDEVYIANIIKCRPPNNRDPKLEEINNCNLYLTKQIEWVKPRIILAVGRIAAQTLLETTEPLSKLRGKLHQMAEIPLVVVYHPAYLLRSLQEKRKAWQDLQLAIKEIEK